MPDKLPTRPNEGSTNEPKSRADSQFRLVTAEGAVVFPRAKDAADIARTVISKTPPAPSSLLSTPTDADGIRGRRLAHFELIEATGVGGMATVIRARDMQLDRLVALKILPPEMAADDENVRRFHQEARSAAKLDHENIARVFFCGEDRGLHFIAFEFVEGENLRVIIDNRGVLPVREAISYLLQVASGLEHAASRGVVHRDIKPSNIIITPDGRAKLVDMGLARSMEQTVDQQLTQAGVTLGTLDYISPEQALEPREADTRSDIYSLGCTFYHMLTGRAPVPEGNAATKVEHHRHVNPVDPRLLNPAIPDEVAAVLNLMMAKNPTDRYQTPSQLIQHLRQIAQRLDGTGSSTDYRQGPLPAPPGKNPLTLIALAAISLAVLLVLLSLIPAGRKDGAVAPPPIATVPDKKGPPPNPGIKSPATAPGALPAKTVEDFADLLSNDKRYPNPQILLSSMDLPKTGLLAVSEDGNRSLTIMPKDKELVTVRFKYVPRNENELVAGLTFAGINDVTISNIRFEIEAENTPDVPVAAVAILGPGNVTFDHCTFVQIVPDPRPLIPVHIEQSGVPVASVLIKNESNDTTRVAHVKFVNECSFYGGSRQASTQGGQVAIAISGPADVETTDCAFRPHAALFHFRDDQRDSEPFVSMSHCAAFVVNGPAFRLDDQARCSLRVEQTVFSCPDAAVANGDEPHLIRQVDSQIPAVHYEGLRNCYHNLNAFWVWPQEKGSMILTDLTDFRTQIQMVENGRDDNSTVLPAGRSPWASLTPLREDIALKGFVLRSDLPELKTSDGRKYIGITMLAPIAPPARVDTATPDFKLRDNEIVVDSEDTTNAPGVFKSLKKALAAAKPGDTLLIKNGKKSREIDVAPQLLDEADFEVTLKAFPGCHPILTMANTDQKDAAFFRINESKLRLEGIEFVVEPDQDNFKAQSVVLMAGNSWVSFKDCVLTLKATDPTRNGKRVPLSVVSLLDPDELAKTTVRPVRTAAELRFTNCFIRGEGDMLSVRASRPFDLDMENCLVGLTGALVDVQGSTHETSQEQPSQISLSKVSTFLTESCLALHTSKISRGLITTNVRIARDCLFVQLDDKPLILAEGNETSEEGLKRYVDWNGEHNAFFNVDTLLEQQHPEKGDMTLRLLRTDWTNLFSEVSSQFPRGSTPFMTFPMLSESNMWLAVTEQFRPTVSARQELSPFGAVLEQLPSGSAEH